MGLRHRRITSKFISSLTLAKCEELWRHTIHNLSAMLHGVHPNERGKWLLPSLVFAEDEVGVRFLDMGESMWVDPKAQTPATLQGAKAKDQFTMVPCYTIDGTLVRCLVIFKGKTRVSLPPARVIEEAKAHKIVVAQSPNHWSNKHIKKGDLDAIAAHREIVLDAMAARNGGFLPGRENFLGVVLLDCWPVNISAEIRAYVEEKYKDWMRLIYVPANFTGFVQPGDTHLHKPMKVKYREQLKAWLTKRHEDAHVLLSSDDPARRAQGELLLQNCFSVPTLREMSVKFLPAMLKLIVEPCAGTQENLIAKAFRQDMAPQFPKMEELQHMFLSGPSMKETVDYLGEKLQAIRGTQPQDEAPRPARKKDARQAEAAMRQAEWDDVMSRAASVTMASTQTFLAVLRSAPDGVMAAMTQVADEGRKRKTSAAEQEREVRACTYVYRYSSFT